VGQLATEIAIMKKCHHEHVIKLLEVIDDPDSQCLYIVMEYCEKGNLLPKHMSDWKPYPANQVRDYIRQLVEAVDYLHHNHIIHRDIKPSNILLTKENMLKLCDFGISDIISDVDGKEGNDLLYSPEGTALFLPPESTDETTPFHGYPADIWALGITSFCIAFGFVPFNGKTREEIFEKTRNTPINDVLPPNAIEILSEDGVSLISQMLEKDPLKRPKAAELMNNTWLFPSLTLTLNRSNSAEGRGVPKISVTEEDIKNAFSAFLCCK
jgi:serine/threonine protein kinase